MSADFGANDWLVEEMYERYQADPTSVEPSWIEFFKTYTPGAASSAPITSAPAAPAASAPKGGTPPVPKAAQKISAPVVAAPVAQAPVVAAPVAQAAPSTPTPAQAPVKPVPVLITPSASTLEPLRGVAGRVVASMEASLSVPTATSVRAIPAKLMIDNRTVITNHLKRTRGGKVSFT
ncbi:MAG: multifunctional oxoglutarate decarboxylase/oxoglutarate dehydrogenase thiamine pyrophosphate-binding subunit/dihydrolipoyllysine-residue succinyltransferase subunit, partial [Actinobacteria bacterium]|nr:multifunctional oxoglutarate decarboxylase/oxoglutarate dehydrogenase thiamine pyrophosphate-binding subunit/dihydrolipoyllysine-residue succinyltransferase subunit [Actinomycetota bacterium]